MNNLFQTRNRKLEQFLHLHDIHFIAQEKDHEGMNVWKYEQTPEFERVFAEWQEIQERRKAKR